MTVVSLFINNGAKFIKFGRLVVAGPSEGQVSQILYLGPSLHFMKSKTFSCKKMTNLLTWKIRT